MIVLDTALATGGRELELHGEASAKRPGGPRIRSSKLLVYSDDVPFLVYFLREPFASSG